MTRHLVVAGVQRCGTTSVVRSLMTLPGVVAAEPPLPEPKVLLGAGVPSDASAYETALLGRAAPEGAVVVEKTTSYLETEGLPERLLSVLPDAHVAVVVRDPVARAVSHHRYTTEHGLEDRPLLEALEADLRGERREVPAGVSMDPFAYVRRGRYEETLRPWVARLPPGRLHVLVLEQLRAAGARGRTDPRFAALLDALGLPTAPAMPLATENRSASGAVLPTEARAARDLLEGAFAASTAALEDRFGLDLDVWRRPEVGRGPGAG